MRIAAAAALTVLVLGTFCVNESSRLRLLAHRGVAVPAASAPVSPLIPFRFRFLYSVDGRSYERLTNFGPFELTSGMLSSSDLNLVTYLPEEPANWQPGSVTTETVSEYGQKSREAISLVCWLYLMLLVAIELVRIRQQALIRGSVIVEGEVLTPADPRRRRVVVGYRKSDGQVVSAPWRVGRRKAGRLRQGDKVMLLMEQADSATFIPLDRFTLTATSLEPA